MSFSLLYKAAAEKSKPSLSEKILYHLSLDRSLSYICADSKKNKVFLDILSHLLCNQEEVLYRHQVLNDFICNPELIEILRSALKQLRELHDMNKNIKRNQFHESIHSSNSVTLQRNQLQSSALCMKRVLLLIKNLADKISSINILSEGLVNLKNLLDSHIIEKPFFEMITMCNKFQNYGTSTFVDLKVSVAEDGKINDCRLISHDSIKISDPDLKKVWYSFKKTDKLLWPCARVYPKAGDNYEKMAIYALSNLSKYFMTISDALFNELLPIENELDFYQISIQYIEKLREKNIPFTFPKVSENSQTVHVKNLYDLFLVMSPFTTGKIVPNDVCISNNCKGILLFGDNGEGKTVYLRSIATMQILAQSGLPVPATYAEIPLYNQIVTQFSESEEEFSEQNESGRFEKEVSEIAAMVDLLTKGALVFLNETFQTTAYSEAADGIYNILEYFSKNDIRWIFVTHLRELEFKNFHGDIMLLQTTNNYKVIPKPVTT